MEAFDYVLFFLKMVFYTIGAVVICGLVVGLCERLFLFLMGPGVGRGVVIGTSIIGTPIHELSHALMCLIFGHKIQEIKLWQPSSEDGTLGYVTHAYHPRNLYHILGNLFIGVGPIFGGLGIITLCMLICFPNTLSEYVTSATAMVQSGEGIGAILLGGLKIIPNICKEFSMQDVPVWGRIIALIVMFSVSLHINLSLADIKGAATAIPLYLVLVLIPTVIVCLIGYAAMDKVMSGLEVFNALMFAMFTIVFVFVLLQLLIAFVVFLLRKFLGRR